MPTLRTSCSACRVWRVLAVSAALLVTGCAIDRASSPALPMADAELASLANDGGRVTHYDIMDWVLVQGSYCARPENRGGPACGPPFPGLEISGFSDPVRGTCGFVDYGGFATRYLEQAGGPSLGTTYAGSITERLLNDGLAEVTVTLRTENALAFALPCAGFPFSPLLIGAVPTDILAGAEPAIGAVHLSFTYLAPPGYALPELLQFFIGEPPYELLKMSFHAQASGPLHAASGFPEGTLGRLDIQQVGRVTHGQLNRERDYPGDFWPVEYVTLRPIPR